MTGILGKIFGSPIFTWWNSATFGTRLFTATKGTKVGSDDQGNIYYQEKKGKRRWVIYKNGPVEASRVPADWHGWLHYTMDTPPTEQPLPTKEWEKEHKPTLTGTEEAYSPIVKGARAATTSDYEAWKPE
ncbi:NADH:ubiquinone oxidoreductase subunit NDUFA12 [Temperatibacter marinus]|uniref:NADH:ubiquinone oxidoreductase subunit NDUFA12 n=1 Tax=Temperatibacter marinus TaxID=1456591 RepID=A0AA52EHA6_9PROT|nr:NADH:ubiquinone oxidoreductase subunit NDUFA12 [Temperatibacter marinus]WND02294.1 NADH:ubiquinone oxidoreductase subunit NDUFA12 [Temperatibacter marinus]